MRFSEPNATISQRRSYVDLPSNTGIIGSLLTTRDLGKFVAGKLNPESLPSLIHESTHHWCFQTPVGLALSILYFRSMATITGLSEQRTATARQLQNPMSDLVRYERAVEILEPLIEGLALFAEFDLTGTSDDVWPLPLTWAVFLYGGRDYDNPSVAQLMAKGSSLMTDMRGSDQMISRKIDVLLGTLKPSVNPYLSGYLAIKWAWHSTANQLPCLTHRDAFFVFIKHYIFCDLELVRLLLSTNDYDFLPRFAERVYTRFDRLHHRLSALNLRPKPELLRLLDGYEWTPQSPPDDGLLGLSSSEREQGQDAINSAIADLEKRANDPEGNSRLWPIVIQIINERDALVLDRCEVHVDITVDGVARVNLDLKTGQFFVAGGCERKELWGAKGAGYATMLISRTAGVPYFAICYRGEVIFEIALSGDLGPDEQRRYQDLALGVGRTGELMEAWHSYMKRWAEGLGQRRPDQRASFNTSPVAIRAVVDHLYSQLSMPPWLSAEDAKKAAANLEAGGIGRLFPRNRIRLLPVMVGWSLGKAQEKHLDALIKSAQPEETLLDIITDVNAEAKKCWGAELFVLGKGKVQSLTL